MVQHGRSQQFLSGGSARKRRVQSFLGACHVEDHIMVILLYGGLRIINYVKVFLTHYILWP